MAGMVLTFVDAAIQIGTLIAGIFADNEAEKDFRNKWTPEAAAQLSTDNPGKNIMVVYTEHDASGLVGVEKKAVECETPGGAKLAYVVYIFDEGKFVLKGDGGFLNWCMMGTFDKQDKTVTFSKTPQAIQMEADKKKADEDAAAAKKAEEDAAAKKAEEDAAAAKKAEEDAAATKKAEEDAAAAKKAEEEAAAGKAEEDSAAPQWPEDHSMPFRTPRIGIPSVPQNPGHPSMTPETVPGWEEGPPTGEQQFEDPQHDAYPEEDAPHYGEDDAPYPGDDNNLYHDGENDPYYGEENDPYTGEELDHYNGEGNDHYTGEGHDQYDEEGNDQYNGEENTPYHGDEDGTFDEQQNGPVHAEVEDNFGDVNTNDQPSGWDDQDQDQDEMHNPNGGIPFEQGAMDTYGQAPMNQGHGYAPRQDAYAYAY